VKKEEKEPQVYDSESDGKARLIEEAIQSVRRETMCLSKN